MKTELVGSTNGFVNVPLEAIALEVEDSLDRDRIMNDMQKFRQMQTTDLSKKLK